MLSPQECICVTFEGGMDSEKSYLDLQKRKRGKKSI